MIMILSISENFGERIWIVRMFTKGVSLCVQV